ncbi:MAG: iron complex transport system ATP-binding protein [Gammaproteobacteria bacterium]|jgi:iron complex transport system ATP-binding protein
MLQLIDLKVCVDDRTLLDVDNFALLEGEVFSVLGKNGAGKSTLFKAICGDMASMGCRIFHQRNIRDWSRRSLARHLAVLPQSSQLNFPFSVREVVSLGLIPLNISRKSGQQLVNDKLELTDTIRFADRPYLNLSGGERQRAHLARILVQLSQAEQAPLLLLDEPTSAQDLAQQHQLLQLVSSLSKDNHYSTLLIIHDINMASLYSDRVGIIDREELSIVGSPQTILTPDLIEDIWGYRPQQISTGTGAVAFL